MNGQTPIELVRSSCNALLASDIIADAVQINESAITPILNSLTPAVLAASLASTTSIALPATAQLPLRFDTREQELGAAVLCELLATATAERAPSAPGAEDGKWGRLLKEHAGRGLFDVVRYGVMAMWISGVGFAAKSLKDISLSEVSSTFDLPVTREVPHPTLPAVTVSEPHPLRPFVTLIRDTLNETGKTLERIGCPHGLGEFIARALGSDAVSSSSKERTNRLLNALISQLPAFNDTTKVAGIDVKILRGAQKVVLNLHQGFSESDASFLLLEDPSGKKPGPFVTLTAIVDDTVPQVLLGLGVLAVGEGLSSYSEQERLIILRAAAVAACERIVQMGEESGWGDGRVKLTETDLSRHFWLLGRPKRQGPAK
ncbi:hypothetical protein DFJ73DRAFT_870514 [Zopfochytrium polystomum]|nr:hypothetical protein DFJ73DRAFT_870514 [Zopfochytrium polystomum]